MERLPAFKSGNPTQRAPAARTTPASVRPPVTTNQSQRPSLETATTSATGARPKTSVDEQKGVANGSAVQDGKTARRGSLSGTSRR